MPMPGPGNPLGRLFAGLARSLTRPRPRAAAPPGAAPVTVAAPPDAGTGAPRPRAGRDDDRGDRGLILPHHETFASVWSSQGHTYRTWRDEAQKNSLDDALAMRHDGFIH